MISIRIATSLDIRPLEDIAKYHNIHPEYLNENWIENNDLYVISYWTEVIGSFGMRDKQTITPMMRPEYMKYDIMSACVKTIIDYGQIL